MRISTRMGHGPSGLSADTHLVRPQTPIAALVVSGFLAALAPSGAWAADAGTGLPPERPAKGLVYDGLTPARGDSPCDAGHVGHFQIETPSGRFLGCTHGPDPLPAGEDLVSPTSAELAGAGQAGASGTVSCIGDGSSGFRVQAIYAYPADMASRFATAAPQIRGWAGSNVDDVVNASAAETGGIRRVRFVTDAACEVVVDEVALTAAGDDTFSNTISQLRSLGYTRSDRKYLVWMDTPPGRSSVYCGIGQMYLDESDDAGNFNNGHAGVQGMVSRVDAGCWGSAGTPVEAHELMHNLGGVQSSAPHSTGAFPSPAGGHCTDDYDVMCYDDDGGGTVSTTVVCSATVAERRFDCGKDDYFSTSPGPGTYLDTHWNTADSRFLESGLVVAPENDHFADATPLTGVSDSVGGTTVGASTEPGEPAHAGQSGGSSVWYRWDAPATGSVRIRTAGSSFDTLLAVYTGGAVDALTPVAANDDVGGGVPTSEATFGAEAGTTYRVAVDGYGGDVGAVALAIEPTPAGPAGGGDGSDEVDLSASRKRVKRGGRVRLTVSVPGCMPGGVVQLTGGARTWTRSLEATCSAAVVTKVRRRTTFRAFVLDDQAQMAAGSEPVTVRARS
jgi:hypothetical protein